MNLEEEIRAKFCRLVDILEVFKDKSYLTTTIREMAKEQFKSSGRQELDALRDGAYNTAISRLDSIEFYPISVNPTDNLQKCNWYLRYNHALDVLLNIASHLVLTKKGVLLQPQISLLELHKIKNEFLMRRINTFSAPL